MQDVFIYIVVILMSETISSKYNERTLYWLKLITVKPHTGKTINELL